VAVTWWDDSVHADMGTLVREHGVNSFKHFMAYKNAIMADDETLVKSFRRALELGAIPTVHAENGELVYQLQQELLQKGITGARAHPLSRPPEVEAEAANRAIAIANVLGTPVYIVHVSCAESLEAITRARAKGSACTAKRWLATSSSTTACTPAKTRVRPRPRDEPAVSQQASPGGAVAGPAWRQPAHDGDRPLHLLRRTEGGRQADNFTRIPNGCGGVEERMAIVWDAGVNSGTG
jgi:dihydropyrimidinase